MQNTQLESQSWLKLFFVLFFVSALGFLSVLSGSDDMSMNLDNPNTILILKLLQGFSALLIFVLPAVLFSMFWTNAKIAYLGITKVPLAITLFIASTGMLMALPLINWLAELNKKMKFPVSLSNIEIWMQESEAKAEILTKAFTAGSSVSVLIVNFIVIAFIAAISEEFFFRGVLQKVLHECFKNYHVAVWTSAIIFSAFHMQFYGFLPRALMGAYLGYVYYWSGSLWVSILAHFVNNGLAVYVIWLSNKGVISSNIDEVGVEQSQWFAVVLSAVMVVSSLYLIYKKQVNKNTNVG